MVDYSKWDQLNFSSDEDDCHPNIEINTWRRLKERYRKEHGLVKREPKLVDKWSSTVVNKEQYDLMNIGNKKEDEKNDPNATKSEQNTTTNDDSKNIDNNANDNNVDNENSKNLPTNEANKNNDESKNKSTETQSQSQSTSQSTSKSIENKTSSSPPSNPPQKTNQNEKNKKKDDDHFYARSDPSKFLEEHMQQIKKFGSIKNNTKADKYLMDNYELIHEAAEGYLITHAVDRAVEGCDDVEKRRLARRCLQIHNLVQSCSTANVGPQKGVELFYSRLSVPQIQQQYEVELSHQVEELLQRIEARRKERLNEMMKNQQQEEEEVEVEAPVGPGGLHPTEVLNSLPERMKEAFLSRDVNSLREALASMPSSEAEYHFQRCIDAGLWVENIENDDNENDANNDHENDNTENPDPSQTDETNEINETNEKK